MAVDYYQFEAVEPPGHFIRHRGYLGVLTREDRHRDDFAFALVRRGEQGLVSLRSKNFPKLRLRHRDFRIRLEQSAGRGDEHFPVDSAFYMERGLADPEAVSFRSYNLPDHYIGHRDLELFILPEDTPDLARLATFVRRRPSVLIDTGTELNPV